MAKIAIFGGTFNPFHIGHYQILKYLCESDMFDKVLLVPDKIPPHKTQDFSVDDEDRIEMCRIVCEEFDKAKLSLIEFEREGKSYTVDTVKALKHKYPGGDFYVVCGGDMIKTLDTWYDFVNLKNMVTFIAFKRGDKGEFFKDIERIRSMNAKVLVFDKDIVSVSSTKLRNKIDSDFLPKKVYDYVSKRRIYKQ